MSMSKQGLKYTLFTHKYVNSNTDYAKYSFFA